MLRAFGTVFGLLYGLLLLIQLTGLLYCGYFFLQMAAGTNKMFAQGNTYVLPVAFFVSLAAIALILWGKVRPWNELCETFPVRRAYTGEYLGFQTMKIGPVINFSACVSIGFESDALNLKLWGFPFSKKMQISWSEITEIREHTMGVYSDIQFVLRNSEPLIFCYSTELKSLVATESPRLGLAHLLKIAM